MSVEVAGHVHIPTLQDLFILSKSSGFQLSSTNLVYIDSVANLVYKATLEIPLNKLSDINRPELSKLGSAENVSKEVVMLGFLSTRGFAVPEVIGTNKMKDVFAMSYIAGPTLLDKLLSKNLSNIDVRSASRVLCSLHKMMNNQDNFEWIKNNTKSYPQHFPNRIEGFLNRYNSLGKVNNATLRNLFIHAKEVLDANPQYMIWEEAIYGDYKPDNLIQLGEDSLVIFDPGLRLGRVSFDVGKFASRLLLHNATINLTKVFISEYLANSDIQTTVREVKHMAALDMITILSVYDDIPKPNNCFIFPNRIYKLLSNIDSIAKRLIIPLLKGTLDI